jgi:hypothetical protein
MWGVFVRSGETGVTVTWFGTGSNDYTNGLFCTLKFKVKDDAPAGESPVTLRIPADAVYDTNEKDVPYTVVPGAVTVTGSEPPTEGLTFTVSSTEAVPGDDIQVQVSVTNNPGVAAVELVVEFDTNVLEWIPPEEEADAQEDFSGMWGVFVRSGETGVTVTWFGTGSNDYTNGLFCTLKFKVKDNAPAGESPVTLRIPDEAVYDTNEHDVPYTVVPGAVTVIKEALADGYYLIGQKGWDVASIDPEQKFETNQENTNEYLLETGLAVGDGIKVVKVENGAIAEWYPGGVDNQYVVDAAHAGRKTIYFHPWYADAWSAFGGYMWIDAALTVGAEVYGSSVSLKGDIALNFFLILPEELTSDTGAYVTLNDTKYPISEAKPRTVGEDTLYQFTIKLHAKQMNDKVTLKVFTGEDAVVPLYRHSNGEDVTAGYEYSVQDYIQKTLETSSDEKLKALVQAMSDYGSLAQAQFNYNVSSRADVKGDLDSVTAESVAGYESVLTTGTATGVTFKGGTLVLESTTAIKLYFTLDEGEIGDYTFKVGSTTKKPTETTQGWMIEIPNISAKDLDKVYTVKVTSGAGTVLTLKYSALSYVYSALSKGETGTLTDLVKGVYLYNQAANAYFG